MTKTPANQHASRREITIQYGVTGGVYCPQIRGFDNALSAMGEPIRFREVLPGEITLTRERLDEVCAIVGLSTRSTEHIFKLLGLLPEGSNESP